MGETVNQEGNSTEPAKTFTQAEVDAIIGDRLKREREKFADYSDLKTKAEEYDNDICNYRTIIINRKVNIDR